MKIQEKQKAYVLVIITSITTPHAHINFGLFLIICISHIEMSP